MNIVRGIGIWGGRESDHCEVKYERRPGPEGERPRSRRRGTPGSPGSPRRRAHLPLHELGRPDVAGLRPHGRTSPDPQVHGGLLQDKQFIQGFIADSYIDIQAARLMTLHAAEKIDRGMQGARTDISAIKVFVPAAYTRVVDRAIQVWGAAGISNDLPLAGMFLGARTLRIADGPDEVHRILIAKNVLGQYAKGEGWDFGN